jgi:hypothetical protein
MKGVINKQEFRDSLPHGSEVYMNPKSFYIISVLFLKKLLDHFIPRKESGKCLFILDGRAAHCSAFELMELADSNAVACQVLQVGLFSHWTALSSSPLRAITLKR